MIGLLHGYLLDGSGSNLWTRSIVQSVCREGRDVHLFCQDPHPERYDFITEAFRYHPDGTAERLLKRESRYSGRCIMHKPVLGETLPVYVWDQYEEFSHVVPMVELSTPEIEAYLRRNTEVLLRVAVEWGLSALHANHAVLMSVVAHRVSERLGVPFAIMPHGSAIEYAVKKDERFLEYAVRAFGAASRVLVVGVEMRERVSEVFGSVEGLEAKLRMLPLGVDTSRFQPLPRHQRPRNVARLLQQLDGLERGKPIASSGEMRVRLSALDGAGGSEPSNIDEAVEAAIAGAAAYTAKLPDQDAERRLRHVDWIENEILLFVGRLISAKGIHCLIAALPEILAARPATQLVVVGHGPLREPLEALLWAMARGDRSLSERILRLAGRLEGPWSVHLNAVSQYWGELQAQGELDGYFRRASELIGPETVVFTGYLTHRELALLYPCCDAAIFPSLVIEAGPLVFLEALSSGSLPVGTYFGGMAIKIDAIAPALAEQDARWLRLDPEPSRLTRDIGRVVPHALPLAERYRKTLRQVAVAEYDWIPIARRWYELLVDMGQESAPA